MNRLASVFVSLAFVALSACGSDPKHLDRDSAKAVLTKYFADKPLTLSIYLPKGGDGDVASVPAGTSVASDSFLYNDVALSKPLVKMGWAALHYRPPIILGGYSKEYVITPVGQKAMAKWTKGGSMYDVQVGLEEAVDVTGVSKTDDTHATIEFTCTGAPNELGKHLPNDGSIVAIAPIGGKNETYRVVPLGGKTLTCQAPFQLFDDGWRVATT